MAATVVVLDDELYEQVRFFLTESDRVVLMPKSLAEETQTEDGDEVDYDFGGDPDVCVDLIDDHTHFFFSTRRNR